MWLVVKTGEAFTVLREEATGHLEGTQARKSHMFATAAVAKYRELVGLNNRIYFFTVLETRILKYRCWQGWFLYAYNRELHMSVILGGVHFSMCIWYPISKIVFTPSVWHCPVSFFFLLLLWASFYIFVDRHAQIKAIYTHVQTCTNSNNLYTCTDMHTQVHTHTTYSTCTPHLCSDSWHQAPKDPG